MYRNNEHYADPTVGAALRSIARHERKVNPRVIFTLAWRNPIQLTEGDGGRKKHPLGKNMKPAEYHR